MNWMALIDGPSALIVFGGTALATVLRCGLSDIGVTMGCVAHLTAPRFDPDRAKARLAAQVMEIQKDGLLRAHPAHFGDQEFDEATDALIANRSIEALLERHESHKARRVAASDIAIRTLVQAAELAPVFGLAGTLASLSQLSVGGVASHGLPAAIAMAVLTTLYGLLQANLLLAPLAHWIERVARAEEGNRQAVIDWLTDQIGAACHSAEKNRHSTEPNRHPAERLPRAAA